MGDRFASEQLFIHDNLALASEQPTPRQASKPYKDSMNNFKTLVLIDDELGVLRALGLLLQTLRFAVKPFNLPLEALAYITAGNQVDLVLTDLRMPEIPGDQVLQKVHQYNPNLPVIVMSGHASAQEQADLMQAGAAGFISKPFTPSQFLRAIEHHPHSQTPSPKTPF